MVFLRGVVRVGIPRYVDHCPWGLEDDHTERRHPRPPKTTSSPTPIGDPGERKRMPLVSAKYGGTPSPRCVDPPSS
jgi:hypothetical protein